MLLLVALILATSTTNGRVFNNPIADRMLTGIVKHDDAYYAASTFTTRSPLTFYVSNDLTNWRNEPVLYNEPYCYIAYDYQNPEITILGDGQFRLHYSTMPKGFYTVSSAFSSNIIGPYYGTDVRLTDAQRNCYNPSILNAAGALYLTWSDSGSLYRQRLQQDGLNLLEGSTPALILQPNSTWDSTGLKQSSTIIRENFYYVFYSVDTNCTSSQGIYVARSLYPLGPYEKKSEPLVVADNQQHGPVNPRIVKDVDGIGDVLLFSAWKVGETCADDIYRDKVYTWAKSVEWDRDGWPYVVDEAFE